MLKQLSDRQSTMKVSRVTTMPFLWNSSPLISPHVGPCLFFHDPLLRVAFSRLLCNNTTHPHSSSSRLPLLSFQSFDFHHNLFSQRPPSFNPRPVDHPSQATMIQAPSRYARVTRVIIPFAALSGLVYLFLVTFIPDRYEAASSSISSSASSLRSSLAKGGDAVRSGYREVSNKKAALLNIDFLGTTEYDGDDGARDIQRVGAQKGSDPKDSMDGHKRTGHHHHHHHHQKSSKQQIGQRQARYGSEELNDTADEQADRVSVNINNINNAPMAETDEPIYEVEKANGVLVVFTSEEQIQDARQTVRDMEDRFNRGRNYPWVILSALPLTERSKILMAQLTKGTMAFGTVPKAHYRLPRDIDVSKSMARDRDLIFAGVNTKKTEISVRHRWRYLSGFLARHELLDGYEFFWRVDPALEIFCDIEDDPMLEMKKNGQKFGKGLFYFLFMATFFLETRSDR